MKKISSSVISELKVSFDKGKSWAVVPIDAGNLIFDISDKKMNEGLLVKVKSKPMLILSHMIRGCFIPGKYYLRKPNFLKKEGKCNRMSYDKLDRCGKVGTAEKYTYNNLYYFDGYDWPEWAFVKQNKSNKNFF